MVLLPAATTPATTASAAPTTSAVLARNVRSRSVKKYIDADRKGGEDCKQSCETWQLCFWRDQ